MKSKVIRLNQKELYTIEQALNLLIDKWNKDYLKIKNKKNYNSMVKHNYLEIIKEIQELKEKINNKEIYYED